MKRVILLALLILCCVLIIFSVIKNKVRSDLKEAVSLPNPTQVPFVTQKVDQNQPITTSVFVPYWTITDTADINRFNSFIYFGIVPSNQGIDADENGALDTKNFLSLIPQGSQKLLALRMVSTDQNIAILQNQALSQKIINGTIAWAKQNQFDGIVLDLEISAIPIGSIEQQISTFNSGFYKAAKENNLKFYQTIYGDTFYRFRPFDVKTIANNSDGIYIMAYDFSKTDGNPGPNFPLMGRETFGYDMTQMSDDFLQLVPNKKLTVVFGMFGYDWPVDNQGNAISTGQPLTDQQIQKEFLQGCQFTVCTIKKDPVSGETQIHYTDTKHQKHIVWFEDMGSVAKKEQYLKTRGIDSFSYWAYSYF